MSLLHGITVFQTSWPLLLSWRSNVHQLLRTWHDFDKIDDVLSSYGMMMWKLMQQLVLMWQFMDQWIDDKGSWYVKMTWYMMWQTLLASTDVIGHGWKVNDDMTVNLSVYVVISTGVVVPDWRTRSIVRWLIYAAPDRVVPHQKNRKKYSRKILENYRKMWEKIQNISKEFRLYPRGQYLGSFLKWFKSKYFSKCVLSRFSVY